MSSQQTATQTVKDAAPGSSTSKSQAEKTAYTETGDTHQAGLNVRRSALDKQESALPIDDKKTPDQWRFLVPYQAVYAVFMDGDRVGKANRILRKNGDKWRIETDAKASKYFLSIRSKEFSEFEIVEDTLRPLQFYSSSKVTFQSARTVEQHFNWSSMQETGNHGKSKKHYWKRSLSMNLLDRMSHSIQLRADIFAGKTKFDYLISYKGKTRNYQYTLVGSETLKTQLGPLKTIKLTRGNTEDGLFTFWLSPDFNYLPVQMQQVEKDKPNILMKILSIEYQGSP